MSHSVFFITIRTGKYTIYKIFHFTTDSSFLERAQQSCKTSIEITICTRNNILKYIYKKSYRYFEFAHYIDFPRCRYLIENNKAKEEIKKMVTESTKYIPSLELKDIELD